MQVGVRMAPSTIREKTNANFTQKIVGNAVAFIGRAFKGLVPAARPAFSLG